MLRSGKQRIRETFSDIGGGDRGSHLYVDENRGFIYTSESLGDTFADGISIRRFDLDFNNEEVWNTDDTYTSNEFGAVFRDNPFLYDQETGNFLAVLSVDDSITGRTATGISYSINFCEIDIDQDVLTNSTISYLCSYRGNPDLASETRLLKIANYDRNDGKIYYHRGQNNTEGIANNAYYITDTATGGVDLEFFESGAEGNISGNGYFDEFDKIWYHMMLDFENIGGTATYLHRYNIFDFANGQLTSTSSNTLDWSGNVYIRNAYPDKFEMLYSPVVLGGDNTIEDVNTIYLGQYDNDLNLIGERISTSVTDTNIVLYQSDESNIIYSFDQNNSLFKYVLDQDDGYIPLLSSGSASNNDPVFTTPTFEILATASTFSIFGATGVNGLNGGGNIDTIGVDESDNSIYVLVNGQPTGVTAKIVKTDLNFNVIDTWDIERNTTFRRLDSREIKGYFDKDSLTFYTVMLRGFGNPRELVKIEVDSMTLSSTTISTLDSISGFELGNGTLNFMFGISDDILYWNHGYQQIQSGKENFFRSHNINTGVETSAVYIGTYSQIRNFYFDQDNLSVYYTLVTDGIRYKYDYNTLTSSVINPYPFLGAPRVSFIGTASVPDPNKLLGYIGSAGGEGFKEVTVNFTSNTYFSNIDPNFDEGFTGGLEIEYISENIFYGYNSEGELYKLRKK